MKSKKNFLSYIDKTRTIVTEANIDSNTLNSLDKAIETTELIVPVVGGFSAGKSTLINSFLGDDILPTGVTPETALATEIRYHKENFIEAVTTTGNVEKFDIPQMQAIKDNAANYSYLRLYLNNDNLAAIAPLVLVDMPGFDAPIESHNQAILSYLAKGCYFIFLTSVDEGNITRSMMREIENINHFTKGFSFGISKTNLRSPDDIHLVKEQIREQLDDNFNYQEEIILFDDNGGHNLKSMLHSINPDQLFSALFSDRLKDNYVELDRTFNDKITTLKTSKEASQNAVKALQQGLDSIISQKEQSIEDIKARHSYGNIEGIINAVSRELSDNKDYLISLMLNDQNSFNTELNELVKSSLLVEVRSHFKTVSNSIIDGFNLSLQNNISHVDGYDFDESFFSHLHDKVSRVINTLDSVADRLNGSSGTGTDSGRIIYRTIATIIGITTSVVSPVLELVSIFLPDILNFFNKDNKAEQERAQMEGQLTGKVIPQIKSKIRQALPEMLDTQVQSLIETISTQFENEIDKKRKEIEETAAEKDKDQQEIEADIHKLETGKDKLLNVANEYLFRQ